MRGVFVMAGYALASGCASFASVLLCPVSPGAGAFPHIAFVGVFYVMALLLPFSRFLPSRRSGPAILIVVCVVAYAAAFAVVGYFSNYRLVGPVSYWMFTGAAGLTGSLIVAPVIGRTLRIDHAVSVAVSFVTVGTVAGVLVGLLQDAVSGDDTLELVGVTAHFVVWQCATAAVLGPALDAKRAAALNAPPTCQACAYDLTGNVSGRCPECGREIPPATQQRIATTQTERRPT